MCNMWRVSKKYVEVDVILMCLPYVPTWWQITPIAIVLIWYTFVEIDRDCSNIVS